MVPADAGGSTLCWVPVRSQAGTCRGVTPQVPQGQECIFGSTVAFQQDLVYFWKSLGPESQRLSLQKTILQSWCLVKHFLSLIFMTLLFWKEDGHYPLVSTDYASVIVAKRLPLLEATEAVGPGMIWGMRKWVQGC